MFNAPWKPWLIGSIPLGVHTLVAWNAYRGKGFLYFAAKGWMSVILWCSLPPKVCKTMLNHPVLWFRTVRAGMPEPEERCVFSMWLCDRRNALLLVLFCLFGVGKKWFEQKIMTQQQRNHVRIAICLDINVPSHSSWNWVHARFTVDHHSNMAKIPLVFDGFCAFA